MSYSPGIRVHIFVKGIFLVCFCTFRKIINFPLLNSSSYVITHAQRTFSEQATNTTCLFDQEMHFNHVFTMGN